jgi:hypothetical protein
MGAKQVSDFSLGEANLRSSACLFSLHDRGGELFEGALDLTDEWVSNQMLEALWSVSGGGNDHAPNINVPGDINQLVDHELQEYAAAVFTKAAGQPDGLHGAFLGLGGPACAEFAMRIEEWRDRYDLEEGDNSPDVI